MDPELQQGGTQDPTQAAQQQYKQQLVEKARLPEPIKWEPDQPAEQPQTQQPQDGVPQDQQPPRKDPLAILQTDVQIPHLNLGRLFKAVVHGGARAVNQTADTAVEFGRWALKNTKAYKLGSDKYESDFLDWYDMNVSETNPFHVPTPKERDTGVYGVVETISQVATGMAALGPELKAAGLTNEAVRLAASGAITDLVAFDPYEARLSNLVESGPEWVSNPLTRYLQADPNDGWAEARLKASMEGLVTGVAFEGLLKGVRVVRARQLARAGRLSEDEAKKAIEGALEERPAKTTQAQDDLVEIKPGENEGEYIVRPKGGASKNLPELVVKGSEGKANAVASSLNAVANRAREASDHGWFTPQQTKMLSEVHRRIVEDGVDPKNLTELTDGLFGNFNHLMPSEDAASMIHSMGEVIHDAIVSRTQRAAEGLGRSHDVVVSDAMQLLKKSTRGSLEQRAKTLYESTAKLDSYLVAGRIYLADVGEQVAHWGRLLDEFPDNAVVADNLRRLGGHMATIHEYHRGTVTNVARALNSQNIGISRKMVDYARKIFGLEAGDAAKHAVKLSENPFKGMKVDEIQNLARYFRFTDGDPNQLLKAMRYFHEAKRAAIEATEKSGKGTRFNDFILKGKTWEKIITYRTNAMLSGIATQAVNMTSNFVQAMVVPAEHIYSGIRFQDGKLVSRGLNLYQGMASNLAAATKLGFKSIREGRAILDPFIRSDEHALTYNGFFAREGLWNKVKDVGTLPTRGLLGGDEFFKQLNYRAHLFAQAKEVGLADGKAGQELADFVSEYMDHGFAKDEGMVGAFTNPSAINYAREQTFQDALSKNSMAGTLQEAAAKHAPIRLIFPFVRTPTNILKRVGERTPGIYRLSTRVQSDLAAGGTRAALAKGRMEMGTMLWAGGMMMAMKGRIHGRGSTDPRLRSQQEDAGLVPYSIQVGGKQIPFGRLEPFAIPLMVMSDLWTAMGEMDEEGADAVASAGVMAFVNSFTSRTYMTGARQFFDALSGTENEAQAFISGMSRSFIPNLLRQANPDPYWREAHTYMESLLANTAGFSQLVEPSRDLFGQKVLKSQGYIGHAIIPYTPEGEVSDPVYRALMTLGKGFSEPNRKRGGVDLSDRSKFGKGPDRQSPYDRWREMAGTMKLDGKTLRARLSDLINSPEWENASTGTNIRKGGARYYLANDLVKKYQEAAYWNMLVEYPQAAAETNALTLARALSLQPEGQRAQLLQGVEANSATIEATRRLLDLTR